MLWSVVERCYHTNHVLQVFFFNFHPLGEVASHYSDTQLQVGENYSYLFNLSKIFANRDV